MLNVLYSTNGCHYNFERTFQIIPIGKLLKLGKANFPEFIFLYLMEHNTASQFL